MWSIPFAVSPLLERENSKRNAWGSWRLSGLLKENMISFQFTSDNGAAYNSGNNILKLDRNMDSNELFGKDERIFLYWDVKQVWY